MEIFKIYNKKAHMAIFFCYMLGFLIVCGRLIFLMIYQCDYYGTEAIKVQERERTIKAARGLITDRNGVVLGDNKTVCTISVVHNQIKEPEKVIDVLHKELDIPKDEILKKVQKVSLREKIKSNVDKEIGDRIRAYDLDGIKVDEDYKRYYPYGTLASKVLGFTGADNQGIIGLEVEYENYLKGDSGKILTVTDARGIEIEGVAENRIEPVAGDNLVTTIDVNIQKYASQAASKVLETKQANYVSIIVMNPNNGEIYAMVNEPEFDLNNPFQLITIEKNDDKTEEASADKPVNKQDLLNKMWRNNCINDTYEPGSTFKTVTATAALEEKLVNIRIRCHKVNGHGSQDFLHATMNSCNPAFVSVGLSVGKVNYYKYMEKLGLLEKTGVDVPGEAGTIVHKIDNVGNVELATMSFGQSFQITPLQLLRAASAIINGGRLVTPHFGLSITDFEGVEKEKLLYDIEENVISKETSDIMRFIMGKVVSEGGGNKAIVEGYEVGGKTATSEKLPRGNGKYISSFIGFAPVENPQVIAICIIDEPTGIYYGGTVAAPVIRELYENILPYLNIKTIE